ncbi:MAG TPA: M1 family metallopeptidase, partial [Acidimicrobiales bacterium]|nr:M1 family metallopeptidase [Acidimicrobiales bacterium]
MTATVGDRYRLGTDAIPSAYRVRLEPDLDGAVFQGVVEVDVDLAVPSYALTLNSADLELSDATVTVPGGPGQPAGIELDPELERATFRVEHELGPGRVTLRVAFRGALSEQLRGFYLSTYADGAGARHPIAVVWCFPCDARRSFPCFDEPALKSTFEITVVVRTGQTVSSNSSVGAVRALDGERLEVAFKPTIPMSTYLVAVVVGPLAQTEPVDVDGVRLSVLCTPGKERLAAVALEAAAFSLRFFTEYFGLPYPGEKLDLVGLPDFAAGAMESLGCVTFRETALLVDPETATTADLERVVMVVAHEIAHMWFGDLVTMAWFEGLWLNEAFATFMSFVCTDAFRPAWRIWVRMSAEREAGLTVDGLHSTRPIEFEVHSPAEAMAMADVITYQKGVAVLRMLEQYLGEATFRDGIRAYLAAHQYANTVTADLWAALEAASGQPVGTIMDTWILQGGHPVVTVRDATLTQQPFQFAAPSGPSAIGREWLVPVRSRPLDGGTAVAQLLGATPAPLASAPPSIVNEGGSGAYRTSYEPAELAALADRLDELAEVERAVLLGDTRALARAGLRSVADVLTIARGLGSAVEPAAWSIVEDQLEFLDRVVDDARRPAFERTARDLFAPVLDALGWASRDGEDERAGLVRATAITVLGRLARDEAVRAEAVARFDAGAVEGELAGAVVDV